MHPNIRPLSFVFLIVLTLAVNGLTLPTVPPYSSLNPPTPPPESFPVLNVRARFKDDGPPGICGKYETYEPGRTRPPTLMAWRQCREERGLGWLHEGHCYGMLGATKSRRSRHRVLGMCHFSNEKWPLPGPRSPSPPLPPPPPPPSPTSSADEKGRRHSCFPSCSIQK
ncbi:hypothetical protein Hypma_005165 [Hypsizygus marmoreus]|uniref:Uncharacterized protein n=1 Tax=Hypsizygus marmoreus TaxID=39966 RepID=A0A369K0R6_HYPMA|nr:hypothetical protein Hypma_005165 [Hypsizygus marmoreus]